MSCPENRYIYLRDIMYERLPHLRSFQIHADGYSKRTALEPEDRRCSSRSFLFRAFAKRGAKVNPGASGTRMREVFAAIKDNVRGITG